MPQSTRGRHAEPPHNLVVHGAVVVKMLRELAEAVNAPYLKPIAGVSLLIFDTLQSVKANKRECLKMTQQTYELICTIINVYQDSVTSLSPAMVRNIGHFSETLGKILSFLRQQVEGSLIHRLVRHAEMSTLLAECKAGLKHAQAVFTLETNIMISSALVRFGEDADEWHRELLKAISMQDHPGELSSNLRRSSSSLSMIPASPKIFHGRQGELAYVANALLHDDPARIVILGVGGIGKSTLALAALHSADVVSKFSSRQYFISCESATSPSALVNVVGRYFGAREDEKPMKAIMGYLLRHSGPSVLVLDNFETPWEPLDTRDEVEEFLSLLSDIKHVDVIVTMRGAERPRKMKWTRPFLPPLVPLTSEAARQIFADISDPVDDDTQVTELLKLTDNLPLAVTLIASLSAYEGCDSVFRRWKLESTAMLSDGLDKRSNLDKSIMLSLTSPRMAAVPGSRELLSLISLLPDGVSEATLESAGIPLSNLSRCRTALCRTSLVFIDRDNRLKTLVPIRQYIRNHYPPSPSLIRPLRSYIYDMVRPFATWERSPVAGIFKRVTDNFGNIHSVIDHALTERDDVDQRQTVQCIVDLTTHDYLAGIRSASSNVLLSDQVAQLIEKLDDPHLQGRYCFAVMRAMSFSGQHRNVDRLDLWADKALHFFGKVGDVAGQAATYIWLAMNQGSGKLGGLLKAVESARLAIQLAEQAGDLHLQSRALSQLSRNRRQQGHLHEALSASYEAYIIAQVSGNLHDQSRALLRQCDCHIMMGKDFRKAAANMDEALELLDALDIGSNSDMHQGFLCSQSEVSLQKTEYSKARKVSQAIVGDFDLAALDVSAQVAPDDTYHTVLALSNIAFIDVATGDAARSNCGYDMEARLDVLRSSVANSRGGATVRLSYFCDMIQGNLHMSRKEYELSQTVFSRCQRLSASGAVEAELALMCSEGLVKTALATAHPGGNYPAMRWAVVYLAQGRRAQVWPAVHRGLRYFGDAILAGGDQQTAELLYGVALDGLTFSDIHQDRAECMYRLGNIWHAKHDPTRAAHYFKTARTLFKIASQQSGIADCDTKLAALLNLSVSESEPVGIGHGSSSPINKTSVIGVEFADAELGEVSFPQIPEGSPGPIQVAAVVERIALEA